MHKQKINIDYLKTPDFDKRFYTRINLIWCGSWAYKQLDIWSDEGDFPALEHPEQWLELRKW